MREKKVMQKRSWLEHLCVTYSTEMSLCRVQKEEHITETKEGRKVRLAGTCALQGHSLTWTEERSNGYRGRKKESSLEISQQPEERKKRQTERRNSVITPWQALHAPSHTTTTRDAETSGAVLTAQATWGPGFRTHILLPVPYRSSPGARFEMTSFSEN